MTSVAWPWVAHKVYLFIFVSFKKIIYYCNSHDLTISRSHEEGGQQKKKRFERTKRSKSNDYNDHPTLHRGFGRMYCTYIYSAQCGIKSCIVHRYMVISHMIIPSNPLAPSFTFVRGLRPDTRRIICLGPVFLRSYHDLERQMHRGHNAKQSFRYLVTIRRLTVLG